VGTTRNFGEDRGVKKFVLDVARRGEGKMTQNEAGTGGTRSLWKAPQGGMTLVAGRGALRVIVGDTFR